MDSDERNRSISVLEENLPVNIFYAFFKLPASSSCILVGKFLNYCRKRYIEGSLLRLGTRTTDAQSSLFSSKSQTFGLGQTIWADKFCGILGIFRQFISTHFVTVSPLSMFFINQPIFLHKN